MSTKTKALSITFTALKVIGVAGAIAIIFVCPNMAQVFSLFNPSAPTKRFHKSRAESTIQRLRANGCIKVIHINGVSCYTLTDKGKLSLAKYELKHASINKPKKWDKKWRMVVFDVREKRRTCRDAIRQALQRFGFQHLQDSVWIHPYPCETIIELACTAYRVRHDAKYIICQRFSGDEQFLTPFDLSGA